MSEDKAKEIIAEAIAKEVVEEMGENLAGALVEYANLVKDLAADLTDEQLEDTTHIKSLLKDQLPNWDWEDWNDLLDNVRREKYKEEHEEQTAEKIFNDMPYFAKAAAQETVAQLLKADEENRLYKLDKAADNAAEILYKMFFCCVADIKMAIRKQNKRKKSLTVAEIREHKRLFEFIEQLREELWKDGEVLKLREFE